MGRILLIALLLVLTVSDADARRRHHRHWQHAPVMMMPGMPMEMPRDMSRRDMRRHMREMQRDMRRGDVFIPAGWTLQPEDPNFSGRRYIAPDGSGWLAFYATTAANDAQARFQAVAFGEGEQVTYLHGARDRLTVSGLKGDRIYYRKVTLACGGTLGVTSRWNIRPPRKDFRPSGRAAARFDHIADELAAAICSRAAAGVHAAGAEAGRGNCRSRTDYSAGATAASCWPERFSASATKPLAFISSMKARR